MYHALLRVVRPRSIPEAWKMPQSRALRFAMRLKPRCFLLAAIVQ
jgi:hypothetical protein